MSSTILVVENAEEYGPSLAKRGCVPPCREPTYVVDPVVRVHGVPVTVPFPVVAPPTVIDPAAPSIATLSFWCAENVSAFDVTFVAPPDVTRM